MKKSLNQRKDFTRTRRGRKENSGFVFASLCGLESLREIDYFFKGRASPTLRFAQIPVDNGIHEGLEILRVFNRQGADFIKFFPFVRRKVPIPCSAIIVKLRQIARTDDHRSDTGHGEQPR